MSNDAQQQDFEAVKKRLDEIADAVDDESLSLDDALDLFEEAVSLGLKVSDFIEEGIVVEDVAVEDEGTPSASEVPATVVSSSGASPVEGEESLGTAAHDESGDNGSIASGAGVSPE